MHRFISFFPPFSDQSKVHLCSDCNWPKSVLKIWEKMFLCVYINLSTRLGKNETEKQKRCIYINVRCASLTCVWVSAWHRYTVLQQLAGLHGLPTHKHNPHLNNVFTLKTMWKWAVAKHDSDTDPVPQVVGCELVICGWKKKKKSTNQPLGILPVPRHVGQVSPVELAFTAPYVGNCFTVLAFSIPVVRSGNCGFPVYPRWDHHT